MRPRWNASNQACVSVCVSLCVGDPLPLQRGRCQIWYVSAPLPDTRSALNHCLNSLAIYYDWIWIRLSSTQPADSHWWDAQIVAITPLPQKQISHQHRHMPCAGTQTGCCRAILVCFSSRHVQGSSSVQLCLSHAHAVSAMKITFDFHCLLCCQRGYKWQNNIHGGRDTAFFKIPSLKMLDRFVILVTICWWYSLWRHAMLWKCVCRSMQMTKKKSFPATTSTFTAKSLQHLHIPPIFFFPLKANAYKLHMLYS